MIKRHYGKITNTGTSCVVIMPSIPGREDHALVVENEALKPSYSDTFNTIVANEGQNTADLYDLLSKRRFVNGSVILTELHNQGLLQAVDISRIIMIVNESLNMPLTDIVNEIRRANNKPPIKTNKLDIAKQVAEQSKTPEDKIKELLDSAENLEIKAQALRAEAAKLAETPVVQPKKRGRKPKAK
jgi:hypothetical protein